MNLIDILLIVCIAAGVILAVRYMRKNKGGCCGDCAKCSGKCFDCKKDCEKEE